jgi:hypothetical protein
MTKVQGSSCSPAWMGRMAFIAHRGRRGRSYKETAELFSIFGFSRPRPSSLVGRRSRFWVVGLLGRCAGLPALPKGLWRQYGPLAGLAIVSH